MIKEISLYFFGGLMIYGLTTEAATLSATMLAGSIGYLLGQQIERKRELLRRSIATEERGQANLSPEARLIEKRQQIREQVISTLSSEERAAFVIPVLPGHPGYSAQMALYEQVERRVEKQMCATP